MDNHGGRPLPSRRRRTRAERAALTVEIGYALCSAVFAAVLAFGAVAGPAFAFGLPDGARHTLIASATTAASVLFAARFISPGSGGWGDRAAGGALGGVSKVLCGARGVRCVLSACRT
ncbi:DUF6332 family protein, partial [Streptomyces caeni]